MEKRLTETEKIGGLWKSLIDDLPEKIENYKKIHKLLTDNEIASHKLKFEKKFEAIRVSYDSLKDEFDNASSMKAKLENAKTIFAKNLVILLFIHYKAETYHFSLLINSLSKAALLKYLPEGLPEKLLQTVINNNILTRITSIDDKLAGLYDSLCTRLDGIEPDAMEHKLIPLPEDLSVFDVTHIKQEITDVYKVIIDNYQD
jgi:hypothetical protein